MTAQILLGTINANRTFDPRHHQDVSPGRHARVALAYGSCPVETTMAKWRFAIHAASISLHVAKDARCPYRQRRFFACSSAEAAPNLPSPRPSLAFS